MIIHKICFRCLFVSFLFISLQTLAQSDSSENKPLEEVVVMANKLQIPFSKQNRNIEIVTAAQIKALPVKSINEVLSLIAGIDVQQRGPNGTQADIGINGGSFDQTLILVNGIKMSDPQTGHNQSVIPVPLDAVERIEVLKGAAASVYGIDAMTGVINIVTKQGEKDNIYIKTYGGSSFHKDDSTHDLYNNYGIEAVSQFTTGKWHHTLTGSFEKGNGYRYNTDYKNSKVLYTTEAALSKRADLQLLAGFSNNAYGANNFYSAPGDSDAFETVRNLNLSAKLTLKVKDNWLLKPYFNFRYGYDQYIYVKQNPSYYENIHHTDVYDFGADNIIYNDWGNVLVGINVRNEGINSTNLGDRHRTDYGGYLGYGKSFGGKFDANANVYFNQNSAFGFNVYPGIDFGYNITESWRVYADAGMGQRLPTFTDLYYSDPGNLGNPDLKPERMTAMEIGIKHFKKSLQVNASAFYNIGTNFIDWVRSDSTQPWQVENFTKLKTFGADASIGNTWEIGSRFKLNAYTAYTYLHPVIGKPSGNDNVPADVVSKYSLNALQHQWVVRLTATFFDKIDLSLANRFLKRYNGDNTSEIDGYKLNKYNLTDVRIAYRFSKLDLSADVNNLWNVRYIETGVVPLPGRWFTLTAGLRL